MPSHMLHERIHTEDRTKYSIQSQKRKEGMQSKGTRRQAKPPEALGGEPHPARQWALEAHGGCVACQIL